MLQKIFISILILIGSFQLSFAQNANELMWKISGKGLKKPSYLYGTMHVKDSRVFKFNDTLVNALKTVDYIASEVDVNSMVADLFGRLFTTDTTINLKDSISSSDYEKLDTKVQTYFSTSLNNINARELWILELMLLKREGGVSYDNSEDQKEIFLDAYLFNIAQNLGRKPAGLELLDDYKNFSNRFPIKERIASLLKEPEEEKEEVVNEFPKLMKLYQEHKIDSMHYMVMEQKKSDMLLMKTLHERNINMARRLDSLMLKGNVLAIVGAAHLSGDTGMINLMKLRGYTVTPIISTYNTKFKLPAPKANFEWKPLVFEDSLYSLKMPGQYFRMPMNMNAVFDMNLYTVYDIYTNFNFMTMNMQFGFNIDPENKPTEMYKKFAKGMKSKMRRYELVDEQLINNDDVKDGKPKTSYEILLKYKRSYIRYSITYIGGTVNVLMVTGTKKQVMGEYANKFFGSLRYNYAKMKSLNEFVEYNDFKYNYKIIAPTHCKTKVEKTSDSENSEEIALKYNRLPINNNTYFHGPVTFNNGVIIFNSKDYLTTIKDYVLKSKNALIKSDTFYLLNKKYPCIEFELENILSKYSVKGKTVLYNNQPYLMYVTGSDSSLLDKNVVSFLNSFTIVQTPENKPKEFVSPDKDFIIRVPGNLKCITEITPDSLAYLTNRLYENKSYAVTNPVNGELFILSSGKTGKYHLPATDSAAVETYFKNDVGEYCSILSSNELKTNGFYQRNILARSDSDTTVFIKYRYVLAKGRIYELSLYSRNANAFQQNNYAAFFDTFKPIGNTTNAKKVDDVLPLLFADILGKDSAIAVKAYNQMRDFTFKEKNKAFIVNVLNNEHKLSLNPLQTYNVESEVSNEDPDEREILDSTAIATTDTLKIQDVDTIKVVTQEEKNRELKRTILWFLLSADIESKFDIFKNYYTNNKCDSDCKFQLLTLLIEHGDSSSLVNFADLMIANPPKFYSYYNLYNDIYSSFKPMYPRILEIINRDSIQWLLDETSTLLVDEVITKNDLGDKKSVFLKKIQDRLNFVIHLRDSLNTAEPSTESVEILAEKYLVFDWNIAVKYIKVIKMLDSTQADIASQKLLNTVFDDWKIAALVQLAKNNAKIDEKQSISILANLKNRFTFYDQLDSTAFYKYYPKIYQLSEKTAELEMYINLKTSGLSEDLDLRLISKESVEHEGEKKNVYLFKYKQPDFDYWYVGAVGFFDKKNLYENTSNIKSYTRYEVLGSQTTKEHLKALVDDMKNDEEQMDLPDYLSY